MMKRPTINSSSSTTNQTNRKKNRQLRLRYVASSWFAPKHHFQVQVDGIIFAEGYRDTFGFEEEPKSSYIVGSSCDASRYCEEEGQSLVQVGTRTQPQIPLIPDLTWEWWTVAYASSLKEKEFRGEKSCLHSRTRRLVLDFRCCTTAPRQQP